MGKKGKERKERKSKTKDGINELNTFSSKNGFMSPIFYGPFFFLIQAKLF